MRVLNFAIFPKARNSRNFILTKLSKNKVSNSKNAIWVLEFFILITVEFWKLVRLELLVIWVITDQTLDPVFHHISRHLQGGPKKLSCTLFFQSTSLCLDGKQKLFFVSDRYYYISSRQKLMLKFIWRWTFLRSSLRCLKKVLN